jgi:hypothetical protein
MYFKINKKILEEEEENFINWIFFLFVLYDFK